MMYLEHLQVLDKEILASLCANTRLSSHPDLGNHQDDILQAYEDYVAAAGAAPASHPMLPASLVEAMKLHYSQPPERSTLEGLINFIRYRLSPGVCPTCGAESAATVDHVYPKSPWPVYSFFSLNLVPACEQCNRKKSSRYYGDNPEARPAHPYFDRFLQNRVVIAQFTGHYATPAIEIVPTPQVTPAQLPVVNWHLENVIRKTQIRSMLTDRWISACRDPATHYEGLKFPGVTVAQAVQAKLDYFDSVRHTPNNWESILHAGVLNDVGAQQYLAHCLANPQENPR